MRFVLLAALLVASTVSGQTLCSDCPDPDSLSCQLWPSVCEQCYEDCAPDVPPPRRVAPIGPSRQRGVDYRLHKTIGLTALNYKDDDFPGWYETARTISQLDFTSAQLWMDEPPYCAGHWVEPYPSHQWVTDDPGCEAEWLIKYSGIKQIFIKPSVRSWLVNDGGCYILDTTPQSFILNRLYEMAWERDITVVFTRWEQDWFPEGCPYGVQHDNMDERLEWLIQYESERQRQFEQARANMIRRYPYARLNVLRAVVVNQFPGYNISEDHPTVSEAIGRMVEDPTLYEPDLVGISYWKRKLDPIPALDWVKNTTHYPKNRMFIAEFGATTDEQPERYEDYIPVFWDWGIKTILIWLYEDNSEGKYTVTPAGLDALRRLNNE